MLGCGHGQSSGSSQRFRSIGAAADARRAAAGEGVQSVRSRPAGGSASPVSAEDLGKIEQGLKRGPETLGYETGLWTTSRVAHLIEQECGVAYHPSQAWRILRQLGWSCQRPTGRAWERDEDKIRRWKQKRWPELKKRPKTKAAPSSSSTRAD